MKSLKISILIILIFQSQVVLSKKDSSQVDKIKLAAYAGLTIGSFTLAQALQYDAYWSDRSDFYVMDWQTEYDDALLADKGGHFFISYALARSYAYGLEWTGLNERKARWIGFGVSMFHQTYVEINDGFSKGEVYLGFSWGDIIANVSGASLALAEVYFPQLRNFEYKISFNRSKNFYKNNYESITHDYESAYHWISIDIFSLLNYDRGFWTDLTRLAIAHSTRDLNRLGAGQHELYLALDWNLKAFHRFKFVRQNKLVSTLIKTIDHYKLPAPAVRLYPDVVWFGLRI